ARTAGSSGWTTGPWPWSAAGRAATAEVFAHLLEQLLLIVLERLVDAGVNLLLEVADLFSLVGAELQGDLCRERHDLAWLREAAEAAWSWSRSRSRSWSLPRSRSWSGPRSRRAAEGERRTCLELFLLRVRQGFRERVVNILLDCLDGFALLGR